MGVCSDGRPTCGPDGHPCVRRSEEQSGSSPQLKAAERRMDRVTPAGDTRAEPRSRKDVVTGTGCQLAFQIQQCFPHPAAGVLSPINGGEGVYS